MVILLYGTDHSLHSSAELL